MRQVCIRTFRNAQRKRPIGWISLCVRVLIATVFSGLLAGPASAVPLSVVISVESPPPVPFGTMTVALDYDPVVMAPVLLLETPDENDVEVTPRELATASGCLVIGVLLEPGTVEATPLCAADVSETGDFVGISFDLFADPPQEPLVLTVVEASTGFGSPIAEEDFPQVGLRLVVPEPGRTMLDAVALAALLGLAAARRGRGVAGLRPESLRNGPTPPT